MLTGRQPSLQSKTTAKLASEAKDREKSGYICSLHLGWFSLGRLPGSEPRWSKLLNLRVYISWDSSLISIFWLNFWTLLMFFIKENPKPPSNLQGETEEIKTDVTSLKIWYESLSELRQEPTAPEHPCSITDAKATPEACWDKPAALGGLNCPVHFSELLSERLRVDTLKANIIN